MLQGPSSLIRTEYLRPNSISISPMSFESLGPSNKLLVDAPWASAAWPSANRAILVPFNLRLSFTVASLWVANGATASGNFDIGIYDDGAGTSTVNRLLSLGSTAQSGTNAPQSVAAAVTLLPGTYYMALVMDGTTGTAFSRVNPAVAAASLGCAQADLGSVVLPSTISIALMATAYTPLFGLSMKASI